MAPNFKDSDYYLIRDPEIRESDVEERSENNPAQDSQHPEPGLVFERSRRVEEEGGHDDDQRQRIVVRLERIEKNIQL